MFLRVGIMTEKTLFLDCVSFLQTDRAPPVLTPTENYYYLHYYHHHPFDLSGRETILKGPIITLGITGATKTLCHTQMVTLISTYSWYNLKFGKAHLSLESCRMFCLTVGLFPSPHEFTNSVLPSL